ncbi:MAG: UDP-3-O-acyl-N-acetylglucosamine deacetylase, partial [Boseongicola sp.]
MQTTLRSSVNFSGTGLHTGAEVNMSVHPASAEYGIWFRRTDVEDKNALIPARWDAVSDTKLCTRITNAADVSVSTVEHVLAALAGCGVH